MPEREPRRFASDVMVYTKDKQTKEACIEVNKPLSIAGWKIYQLSYDETKGKWSRMSVFELVRDPWLPIVYTGILMMIAGAIGLFLSAPVKKELELLYLFRRSGVILLDRWGMVGLSSFFFQGGCRLDRVWLGYILRFYHRDVDLVGEAALAHDGRDSSMVFFLLAGGGRDHLCPLAV